MKQLNNRTINPLVSVIMPVYNGSAFIGQAIESILNQTYQNFELIIVNDASTDNTWSIIKEYQKQNPQKIKAINLPKNLNKDGEPAANVGIQKAQGQFIARMDSDDLAHPQRLAKQVKYLLKNPDVFLVGSRAWIINEDGEIIGEKNVSLSTQDIYREYFIFHPIIHPSVIFRKNQVKRKNFYQTKFSANNDYLTFFELLLQGKRIINLPEKLVYHRVYEKSDCLGKVKEKFLNTLKIRWQMIKKYGYQPTIPALLKNIPQIVLATLLPEKIAFTLYLFARGIYKWEDILEFLKQKLSFKSASLARQALEKIKVV